MIILQNIIRKKIYLFIFMLLALLYAMIPIAKAHDIPPSVTIHMYVKPQGDTLKLLLRVPIDSMSELVYPTWGPGYMDFDRVDPILLDAAQVYLSDELRIYENGVEIKDKTITAYRLDTPQDRSFLEYDTAIANVQSPRLTNDEKIYYGQTVLDILYEFPIQSETSQFSIHATLSRLASITNTVLRFIPPDSPERVFNYRGDLGIIQLDPSFFHAAYQFIKMGFFHILDGTDHILFLLCLVIPLRSFRRLIPVITSFTIAHSITLISTAFGLAPNALWFPPLIEMLIALSIVYMAFENIVGVKLEKRWIMAYGFGLVHGFGFSFLLSDNMQFAGSHLFTSLLAFNIGVEFGQIVILLIVLPLLNLLFKHVVDEKPGMILLSALVAHSGWHWMTERNDRLIAYKFEWPEFNAYFLAELMRWGMLSIIIGAASWLMYELYKYMNRKISY